MLAQRWPYVVHPTPTISQRYNGLPTLAKHSHAIWDDSCKSTQIIKKSHYLENNLNAKLTPFVSNNREQQTQLPLIPKFRGNQLI